MISKDPESNSNRIQNVIQWLSPCSDVLEENYFSLKIIAIFIFYWFSLGCTDVVIFIGVSNTVLFMGQSGYLNTWSGLGVEK